MHVKGHTVVKPVTRLAEGGRAWRWDHTAVAQQSREAGVPEDGGGGRGRIAPRGCKIWIWGLGNP